MNIVDYFFKYNDTMLLFAMCCVLKFKLNKAIVFFGVIGISFNFINMSKKCDHNCFCLTRSCKSSYLSPLYLVLMHTIAPKLIVWWHFVSV